jgi:hypothetical protein
MTVPSSFRTSPQPPLRFPLPGVKGDFPQAKAAATRVLEIDDSLGEAPLALARVIQLYDWDWLEQFQDSYTQGVVS